MTEYPFGPPSREEGDTDPTQPASVRPESVQPEQPTSPFARPPGYAGNVGYGPPAPEPRFTGGGYSSYGAPYDAGPAWPPPSEHLPPVDPYAPTDAYPPPEPWGLGGSSYAPPTPPPSRRKPWIIVSLLVIALVAGGTTIGLLSTDSNTSAQPTAQPTTQPTAHPNPQGSPSPAPSAGASPDPNASVDPTNPLPNIGVPTPVRLLAIGYHAYSSRPREPAEVAIDSAEIAQFKRYGLDQIVGLRALTIGQPGVTSDDYDADISILRFKDAAGAKAELDYSNSRNKKDAGAKTIALPGLPDVTAFLNHDSTGYGIGAFASVGRYQVVLILGGLTPNVPSNPKVIAAEAARVMKALLPEAASIQAQDSGGGSSTPAPAPSQGPVEAPTPTPSGIHA